jgi:RNA polymerase sigma-70 factor (ECF subfamily)
MTQSEYESEVLGQYSRVYQYCQRLMGNPDDAADLVQDVMIRALLAAEQYDAAQGTSGIQRWLFRIARNRCIDWIRSRKRRGEVFVPDMETEADQPVEVDEYEEVLKHISIFDQLEPLFPCLAQLDEFPRIVLWLRMNKHSWPDVAELTGRPVRTCRDAEASALKKVRKCVEKQPLTGGRC